MKPNKIERRLFSKISKQVGIDPSDVKNIVTSFFSQIVSDCRKLPFETNTKIYKKDLFAEFEWAQNIPYIGRIGPVYSRYLFWKSNEAKENEQKVRGCARKRFSADDIEHMAEEILSGNPVPDVKKEKPDKDYKKVWLVGKTKRKLAKQIIKKQDV